MRMEAVRRAKDHAEGCPTCGGEVQRRPHGEVHGGSFVLDGQRVEVSGVPPEGFADPIHLDAITQYFDGGLYRMWPSERYLSRGGRRLHIHVWSAAFGPVPSGCHIHHRDEDVLNNSIANLECLPAREHLVHTAKRRQEKGTHPGIGTLARERAAEWHSSEEGRLWHSRHAKRTKSWTKWKREPRNCPECGVQFDALIRKSGNAQVYCGSPCKVAAYRKRGKANAYAAAYRERQKAKRDG